MITSKIRPKIAIPNVSITGSGEDRLVNREGMLSPMSSGWLTITVAKMLLKI